MEALGSRSTQNDWLATPVLGDMKFLALLMLLVLSAVAFVAPQRNGNRRAQQHDDTTVQAFPSSSTFTAATTPCPEIALRPRMGMEMAIVACG